MCHVIVHMNAFGPNYPRVLLASDGCSLSSRRPHRQMELVLDEVPGTRETFLFSETPCMTLIHADVDARLKAATLARPAKRPRRRKSDSSAIARIAVTEVGRPTV